jgi:hypothetical protein
VGRSPILRGLAAAVVAAVAGVATTFGAADVRIERSPEFVDRVGKAIDRGVGWMRGAQQPGGPYRDYGPYPGGMTALAYYTLRVSGVARDDPAAVKAFEALRQTYDAAKKRSELRTYSVGLMCMAVAEHGSPTPGIDRSGERQVNLSDADAAWMKEMVKLLEDWQDGEGRWSYPALGRGGGNSYDHSNTQYALLGLKAASRAGVRARNATWSKSLKHFLEAQEDDGKPVPRFEPGEKGRTSAKAVDRARGWGYLADMPAYGSMTAGGVGSVVICRSELIGTANYPPGLDAKAEQSARDGIYFAVDTNPGPAMSKAIAFNMSGPMWHYYYLYALERAGVLGGVEWMGENDWYGKGAEFLLKEQLGSGAWSQRSGQIQRAVPVARPDPAGDSNAVLSTCFALLFLKKGTVPVARGALTKEFDDADINFGAAGSLSDADFDDFVDLVLSRWRRAASDASKERILASATAVGPRIALPLIDRLSSTKESERTAALALLLRATGLDHGYAPAATPEDREIAATRWQAWWLANGRSLRYDAATRRLVAN